MRSQYSIGIPRPFTHASAPLRLIQDWLRPALVRISQPVALFWLSWIAILGGIAIRFPSLGLNAEMFGENGTNLYYHATHSSVWENLFEFDYYEYLFWFPRLIALIAVKGFHLRESYPFVTEWIGHVLTGFFYAFFCLARFRRILPSDFARFLLATALGVGLLGSYELYAFVNFAYHGMFLMLILLFSSLDTRPLAERVGLTLLVALVCTSKVHPVVFLPFYALATVLAVRASGPQPRLTPQATYLGVAQLALLIQAATTLVVVGVFRTDWRAFAAENPGSALADVPVYYLLAWLHLLFPSDFIDGGPAGLNPMAPWALPPLLVVIAVLCYVHWKRGHRRVVGLFLTCNGLALLNLAVTLGTLGKIIDENEWTTWFLPFQDRWFYLSLCALFVGTVILVARLFRHRFAQAVVSLAMILFAIASNRDFLGEYSHYISKPEESFSHWEDCAALTDDPDYAIPLNPHPWMLFHNSVELGNVHSEDGMFALELEAPPLVRSAVVLENSVPLENPLQLIALDQAGRELATANQLTPAGHLYPYYHFATPVRASRYKLADSAGKPFAGPLTIRFMGPADET